MLHTENALVEYFVGEKHIYAFGVTKDQMKIYQWIKPENFNQTISHIRQYISQPLFNVSKNSKKEQFQHNVYRIVSSNPKSYTLRTFRSNFQLSDHC